MIFLTELYNSRSGSLRDVPCEQSSMVNIMNELDAQPLQRYNIDAIPLQVCLFMGSLSLLRLHSSKMSFFYFWLYKNTRRTFAPSFLAGVKLSFIAMTLMKISVLFFTLRYRWNFKTFCRLLLHTNTSTGSTFLFAIVIFSLQTFLNVT